MLEVKTVSPIHNCVQIFSIKLSIGKYDVKYHTTTPKHGCSCCRKGVMNIPSLKVILKFPSKKEL